MFVMVNAVSSTAATLDAILKKKKYYCIGAEPNAVGDAVFPTQERERETGVGVSPGEWHDAITSDGRINLKIIGCATYQFPKSNEQHFSGFVYAVMQRSGPEGMDIVPILGDPRAIPPDQIIFEPLRIVGAFDAD